MALHQNSWSLTEEALEEYLDAARLCIEHKKPNGGCLGFPAALLLLAMIEAIGHFLEGERVLIGATQGDPLQSRQITQREPFFVLNHPCFGQHLTLAQIKHLGREYRNLLAHNGRIGRGAGLYRRISDGRGPAFSTEGDHVQIEVKALHGILTGAWNQLDKQKIKSSVERQQAAGKRRHPA